MSNNQEENPKKPKRTLYQFLDKEGFYIILFLCVSIVGATALWVSNQEPDPIVGEDSGQLEALPSDILTLPEEEGDEPGEEDEGEALEQEEGPEESEQPSDVAVPVEPEAPQIEQEEQQDSETEGVPLEEQELESGANIPVMAVPVLGKTGLPYAADRLVYHETLNQWSTHKGIDIHAAEGTPVKAALDGQVVEIVHDTVMGISITIEHNENLLTRYCNLSTDAMVQVGDQVAKGQIISAVGKTASVKTLEGPLLHFQVIVEGGTVNPQDYLPKNN